MNVSTLFIGGDEDTMLPTKEEGDRLVDLMPDCEAISVKDAGHFILDDRFNLTSAIIDAHFDPFNKKEDEKKYDAINDWKKPSEEEIQEAVENRVKPLRDLVSPKFFSTGTDGKRYAGLGKIPSPDGPLLFVANHQLIGLDLGKLSLAFHMILLCVITSSSSDILLRVNKVSLLPNYSKRGTWQHEDWLTRSYFRAEMGLLMVLVLLDLVNVSQNVTKRVS